MNISVIEPNGGSTRRLRVCAYARVSTDSDEQEESLDNQTLHYRTYIQSNPLWEFAGIYSDQGISGFKEKRPGFQKMMEDARSGKIDLILVKSVSRFARNTETVLKFSRELKSKGIGIFFELQNINTLSGEGELMLTILAAFAQAESESNSGNVKTAIRQKYKRGIPIFPVSRIFGYGLDEHGDVTINENEAEIIRLVFNLAEQGIWVSKIADYMNKKGIPAIRADKWSNSSVKRLLTQEAYMGDRILQKTYVDERRRTRKNNGELDKWIVSGCVPPIVSKKQWNRVQDVLAERRRSLYDASQKLDVPAYTHNTYPQSGKMFCPYCGKVLVHKMEAGRRYVNWYCSTHTKVDKNACPGISIPDSEVAKWGELPEAVTVVCFEDEYGMRRYQAYPKEEYEASEQCPYEVIKPIPKPERPKKPVRVHHPKPAEPRYTRTRYPLTGKLFCPNCGRVLTHRWDGDVAYWVCSTNRDRWKHGNTEKCKGMYCPDDVAGTWGELTEPVTVVAYYNEYGHRLYTAYPRDEYEASDECPYRKEQTDEECNAYSGDSKE